MTGDGRGGQGARLASRRSQGPELTATFPSARAVDAIVEQVNSGKGPINAMRPAVEKTGAEGDPEAVIEPVLTRGPTLKPGLE